MSEQNTQLTIATAAAAAVALAAGSAGAAMTTVDHSALTPGASGTAVDTAGLVTAFDEGGAFREKTVRGVTAVGISGGSVNGEIDNNEAITFDFAQPVRVTELTIAHLYTSGNFGDTVDEAASFFVTPFGSSEETAFTLTAAGATAGLWTGSGSLVNTDIADDSGGGAWRVSGDDIFGSPITSLSLGSANPGNASQGDFGFVSMAASAVPAPGAAALLAGAAAVSIRRRRR